MNSSHFVKRFHELGISGILNYHGTNDSIAHRYVDLIVGIVAAEALEFRGVTTGYFGNVGSDLAEFYEKLCDNRKIPDLDSERAAKMYEEDIEAIRLIAQNIASQVPVERTTAISPDNLKNRVVPPISR